MADHNVKLPTWVNSFLLLSALLAAAAALAALIWGRQGHDHAGVVADISVNLNGRIVREHCTTCHEQGGPAGGGVHPDISPHSWDLLGCTACHLGEGMALDRTISHGLPGKGARNVLSGRDLQASCYTCHELSPLPGAQGAWRGYELFLENACDTCHGLSAAVPGGRYGPELAEIGSYLGIDMIIESIRDPKKDPPNSIMPRFPLSQGQARNIAWFLKSRVNNPFHATPMEIMAGRVRLPDVEFEIPPELSLEGTLLVTRKCLACHKFGQVDGRIAPDLTWIGSMRSPEYLENFLINAARRIPGAIMPRVLMPDEDMNALITFLSRQATGPVEIEHGMGGARFDFDAPPQQESAAVAETKHLYMMLCQVCHAAAGDGHGLIQPNLANFPRAFAGNADFYRTTTDERLLRSIEKGIPGTSMPPYERLLEKRQIGDLLDLAYSAFIGISRNEKIDLPSLPPRPEDFILPASVERRFTALCIRCHGRAGTGKGPAQRAPRPRPRHLTNRPYFAALEDETIARAIADGIPGTAMPSFRSRLTPGELWGLVEKVRRLSGEPD